MSRKRKTPSPEVVHFFLSSLSFHLSSLCVCPDLVCSQAHYDVGLLKSSEAAFEKLGNKISVIGIGKLGLCFALSACKVGYDVVGVDVFPEYIEQLNAKQYRTNEPDVAETLAATKLFRATTDMKEAVDHADVIFVLVATPTVGGRHMYDHSNLGKVLSKLNACKFKNKHVVISSTVMPGYIRKIGRPLLSDCAGVTVSYNPAFVAQGEVMKGYATGGFFGLVLVGGDDEEIYHYLSRIYIKLATSANTTVNVAKLTPESAEIAKISSNCFRTMKIAYANMIGDICDATEGSIGKKKERVEKRREEGGCVLHAAEDFCVGLCACQVLIRMRSALLLCAMTPSARSACDPALALVGPAIPATIKRSPSMPPAWG